MLLNDKQIIERASQGMITPFSPNLVKEIELGGIAFPALSWGVSSFGFDAKLSDVQFKYVSKIPGSILDPKKFDEETLIDAKLYKDYTGDYFILPGQSYGLGVTVERFEMPSDLTAICLTKSTYARMGVSINTTVVDCGFKGWVVIELYNPSPADCKIYANEGIAQFLFLQGEEPQTTYESRSGKYQNQPQEVVTARI